MRRAVNFLQSLHRLHADEITPDDVRDVAILCPQGKIDEVINSARSKSYDNMLSKVQGLLQVFFPSSFPFFNPFRTATQLASSWNSCRTR